MDNAGCSSSLYSEEYPGLAHYKLQSARDEPENILRVAPLLFRSKLSGLFLWGHLNELVYRDSPASNRKI